MSLDKAKGMLFGLAIGDALGNTTEGMTPRRRHQYHGEIRDYLPNRHADGKPVGTPTDDTQLAFRTLEQLLDDEGLNPRSLAGRFSRDPIFGIGGTVSGFLSNLNSGKHWTECGPPSAGNGALMRIAPMTFPHLRTAGRGLWADAAISAIITHNDTASLSACVAFTNIYWQLLGTDRVPAPEWWLDTYLATARDLETGSLYEPRSNAVSGFSGSLCDFLEQELPTAYRQGKSVREACDRWYSGAYLLETVPAALLILTNYGQDPQEAVVRAVNDTKDNDTIAAVVGAAVGALHGKQNLPQRWISNLLGRTALNDDGRVFKLIEKAEKNGQKRNERIS